MSPWLLLACVSQTLVDGSTDSVALEDTGTQIESVGGYEVDTTGESVFRGDLIHVYSLDIDANGIADLRTDPRSYVEATFTDGERTWQVGVRLKGNTSFTWFDEKPALIVDFDFLIEDQDFNGIPSFYLQNMTWDPSMIHEHLAYYAFRRAGVPASRSAYTHLTINGEFYGLYLVLEKQNSLFRKQWWDDASGSVYEAGSFNHPCDLDNGSSADPCTCYEIDRVGEDTFEDLQELCRAARAQGPDWVEVLSEYVDWPVFLRAMTTEIVVGHYDNYGWNINNYRLYHEPTKGKWYWTPWSTDLAFGWYPWISSPHCGTYANSPSEYQGGYLMRRCFADPVCLAELEGVLAEQVDAVEAMDLGAELERVVTMIHDDLLDDPRTRYSSAEALAEVECVRQYVSDRPRVIREWLARGG